MEVSFQEFLVRLRLHAKLYTVSRSTYCLDQADFLQSTFVQVHQRMKLPSSANKKSGVLQEQQILERWETPMLESMEQGQLQSDWS